MSDLSKIALIREMLDSAEKSIRSAHRVLAEISGESSNDELIIASQTKNLAAPRVDKNHRIIEGIFDGEKMIDKNERTYPVPANYASKSKLVAGDHLKLTITEEGKFLFKQIGPADRKSLVGPLTFEDGQYKVLTNGKAYKVLLASVTFFRAEVGDEVTVLVPTEMDVEWAAIEAVLPKIEDDQLSSKDVDFEI